MVAVLVLGLSFLFGQAYRSTRVIMGNPEPAHDLPAYAELLVPVHAERAGQLPRPENAAKWSVDGIKLPEGHLIISPAGRSLAWVSNAAVVDIQSLWLRLAARFDRTGLWPLASRGLSGDLRRPWSDAEDLRHLVEPADVDAFDAKSFLVKEVSSANAAAVDVPVVPITLEQRTQPPQRALPLTADHLEQGSLLILVPTARPADALNALGWTHGVNYDLSEAALAAVLRSWEDRFGAVLTSVDFDAIDVEVTRPPGADLSVAVGYEHYGFCPDNIDQGAGTLSTYARQISGARTWKFWWD
ncbi:MULTISPECIES: DUF4253 domain-containing protein [Mycobacteroides]|uniref:DUF4253 domain-containing protein n=1 Tax=Mycobacteroides chelonae TaxID=1774 RepID=A0A1S1LN05_MYCCH|nr:MULTISPECIES: DUF4253 domain-containing protein [Mycobacteroides]KRQ20724.1 hypothetical protein AOT91_26690 [Mycobacteroides sp. H092]KRQ21300.1 hypothetical protein AOT87_16370 [Mycobacteroides sp. H003]KRQ44349.1 hypothetical protein AOT88_21655 [Mycobacteroides sp. H063]KRQ45578.1 hypothetical protein AOT92_02795 [Mycobacteroides sp. H101]KRQ61622.1 hypothetical protein AOT94_04090 [Mycobacteroides sp. HXVII]